MALSNGVFTTPGQIRKRYGTQTLPTASTGSLVTTITQGNFLANYGSELLLGDGFSLWSYSANNTNWVYKGHAAVAKVTTTSLFRNAKAQTNAQQAQNGTAKMITWLTPQDQMNYLMVVELATGNILAGPVALNVSGTIGAGCSPVVNLNGALTTFYVQISGLLCVTWNGSSLVYGNPGITVGGYFDATVNATEYVLTYCNSAQTGITTQLVSTAFVPGASVTQTSTDAVAAGVNTYWNSSTGETWVATVNNSSGDGKAGLYAVNAACTAVSQGLNYTNSQAGLVATAAAVISNASNTYLWWSTKGNATTDGHYPFATTYINTYSTLPSNQLFAYGVMVASKPWYLSYAGLQVPCINTWHDSDAQATYFAMALPIDQSSAAPGTVIAKSLSEFGAGSYSAPLATPTQVGAAVELVGLEAYATTLGELGITLGLTGITGITYDFGYTNPNTTLLNANLIIGGGTVRSYDGATVAECGFHLYPEYAGATLGSGGNLNSAGVSPALYQWATTYEWIDNQGQVHQSAPSFSPSYSATAGQSATVYTPGLDLTDKQNVNVVFWRTQVNGTVFYRLNLPNNTVLNDPGSIVSYVDTSSDATIAGNPQLYTTGEAANIAPPPSVVMTSAQNRTVLVPSEQNTSWWFSKENPPGSPPEFSDEFVNNADPTGGAITAMAQMDGNLLLLKNNMIYYVAGTGPANSGAGSTYTDATLIPTTSGSVTNHVVLTTQGLMYQSQDGIWMLTRSLSDTFIGAPVSQYTDAITAATLIPTTTQVRFLTAAGYSLVYDYFANEWSTFSTYSGVSGLVVNGIYTALTAAGVYIQETPGSYSDSGAYVPLSLTLGWLEMAGLQGFQRVRKMYLLGDWKSAHNLTVQFAYDFGSITQTDTFAVPGLLLPYQFRFFMNVQKCQAIQVTIADSQLSSQGEGFALSSLAFEVALKKGLSKNLNPNQSFG